MLTVGQSKEPVSKFAPGMIVKIISNDGTVVYESIYGLVIVSGVSSLGQLWYRLYLSKESLKNVRICGTSVYYERELQCLT